MGHSATYTTFDLVIRAWRAAGHEVRYVQNVTDVDDPLLERARDTGEDWRALAERETDLFREDMAALSVIPPDVFAGAVESIPIIIELIEALHSRGAVYDVDGDLYYPVAADPHFAEVSGWTREQMMEVFAERGGDPDRPGKRDPLDALLWQRQRDGDPGWESPFGVGRPGMARRVCGDRSHLPRVGLRRPGRRHRPDLPAPRDVRRACAGGSPGERFRPGLRPSGHGRASRATRCRSRSATSCSSRGCAPTAWTRRRSGWCSATSTTATTGSGRAGLLDDATKRLAVWRDAVRRTDHDLETTVDAARAVRAALADDLDAPRALEIVDAWAEGPGSSSDAAGAEAGRLMADTVQASLGIQLCSRPGAAVTRRCGA